MERMTITKMAEQLDEVTAENERLRAERDEAMEYFKRKNRELVQCFQVVEQARAALRPFAVMGNVYKQYSDGVWGETIDYAEDENDEVQRVLMSDFIHAAAVYQQLQPDTAEPTAKEK